MPDTRAEIGDLWRSISKGMHEHFRQALQDSNLHFGALMVLRHVQREPGVTVSELARRSGVVKSHASKMIEQLCRDGYLEKRPDDSDQRLLHVYLTASAVDRVNEMEALAHRAWSRLMDAVPEGQLDDVLRGFKAIAAALEQTAGRTKKD